MEKNEERLGKWECLGKGWTDMSGWYKKIAPDQRLE